MNRTSLIHLAHLLRSLIAAWAMIATLMLGTSAALGADVLIVMDSGSGPLTEAADRAEQVLESRGHTTTRVLIDNLDLKSLENRTEPVLAIGTKSAVRTSGSLRGETLLVYSMTSSPNRRGLTKRQNTSGVGTDPDIARQIEIIEMSGIRVNKIGMMYNSGKDSSKLLKQRFERALPNGWTLVAIDVNQAGSVSNSIDQLFKADVDLVWTAADTGVYNSSAVKALLRRSIRDRVPGLGFSHALVRAGAPFGVGFQPATQGQRAAELIISGTTEVHEPANAQVAINETALSRIELKLSSDLTRLAEVRFGTD